MTGITRRFGEVTVLRGVDFEGRAGEVHVLAGENGAGKSTLIRILAGLDQHYEGTVQTAGPVAVIHQELSLIGSMSVADNIFLGRNNSWSGLVRDDWQNEQARHSVSQLGLEIDVREPIERFPAGTRQMLEIAKALSQDARIIIMDEPTSALNTPEVGRLFRLIESLKERGCCIIYITHKMEEIERIADRITVLRDGQLAGTAPAVDLPPKELIQWMVGRDLGAQFPRHGAQPGAERLRLENFSVYLADSDGRPAVENVSLTVRAGEVLGIGGLQGSGASELFLGVFGAAARTDGSITLDGRPVRLAHPRQALDAGVALLTNDRKGTGLVLSLSIIANATLADLPSLSPGGWRRPAREREATDVLARQLNVRAASLEMETRALSGGNQQKVALAKALQTRPKVLLLDEPTKGIDVGAKREIYQLFEQWTAAGIAILLITSEMPELLRLSDRIIVLHRGRVSAEFSRGQASSEAILAAAMGRGD